MKGGEKTKKAAVLALLVLITVASSATFAPTFAQEENPEDGAQACVADLPGPLPEFLYLAFVGAMPEPMPHPELRMMTFDGSQWGAMPEPIPHPEVAPFSPTMAFDPLSGVLLMASTADMEPTSMEANIMLREYDGSEWWEGWLPSAFSAKGVNPSLVCGYIMGEEAPGFQSFLFWEDRSTTPSSIRYTNLLAEVPSYDVFENGEQPAAAIYNSVLFLFYVRGDTLVYRTYTGGVWSEENPYGSLPVPLPHPAYPSMDVGAMPEPMPHPVLYLAYEVNPIYYHTFDDTSWSSAIQLGNYGDLSPSGPALCTFNDQLYIFYKSDGHVYYQTLDGEWSAPTLVPTEGMRVHVDIKPECWPNPVNVVSKGVLPVAICGTEDLDVNTIDPSTVKMYIEDNLEGVSPLRWSYEDVATPYTGPPGGGHALGPDGYLDLIFHFGTQAVVALDLSTHLGETIPLIIRGNLKETADGTAFEGQDYVQVIVLKR